MRDEKEARKKQARANKQTRQSNTAHMYMYVYLDCTLLLPGGGLGATVDGWGRGEGPAV